MSSELIIEGLALELQPLCREHRVRALALGIDTLIPRDGGTRTSGEQIHLYGRGRDFVDGHWVVVDPALIVTNAMPEQAPHCHRGAYDLVPLVDGKVAWDRLDLFAELGRIGKELGLVWGGDWPKLRDMPHFELPNWRALPLTS